MKPKVVISKCIEFDHSRWDGRIVSSEFVKRLNAYVDFEHVCPEVEIGLGVPRNPIRIVSTDGKLRLMQLTTDLDVTDKILSFTRSFLDSLPEVDGFILKSRSPTCAIKDAKVYLSKDQDVLRISKGPGFFGHTVLERFPLLAIEDEERLWNPRVGEDFMTKIFALAHSRKTKASDSSD
ncbi:DUF523 domain-containing protein [Candidatus Bathyarchaeota archaeon]|nr:DUF523 domain-containing protein [Candidatus Bathyarchaeota archaeon]